MDSRGPELTASYNDNLFSIRRTGENSFTEMCGSFHHSHTYTLGRVPRFEPIS
eukprot:c32177_g1_i1 orf=102-260(+)